MKLASKTLFTFYLIVLTWLVLFKFSFDLPLLFAHPTRTLNLLPFTGFFTGGNAGEMVLNLIIFVPFGLLASVNLKHVGFWQKLRRIFFFSLAVETLQFVFGIGISDITDVITNTAGGFIGLALYQLSHKYVRSKKLDRITVITCALLFSLIFYTLFSHIIRVRLTPTKDVPLASILIKNAQLEWPTTGHAAVGTVEAGVLASSLGNEQPLPTASMAKVITALAILEKQPLELGQDGPSYTFTSDDVANYDAEAARGGSVLPVYEGMTLTQYEALQAMLIASANNMADTLVEKTFGSQEAYISYASAMLQRMGLSHTTVADASGFSPATTSTPSELVAIGIAALKNPVIADIVSQPQAWIVGAGNIKNTNELLGTDSIVGIKTGTTDSAGKCLLFAAKYNDKNGKAGTIVGVVMSEASSASLFSDSKRLLASVKQGLNPKEKRTTEAGSSQMRLNDAPR